jgi:hypothetical protein
MSSYGLHGEQVSRLKPEWKRIRRTHYRLFRPTNRFAVVMAETAMVVPSSYMLFVSRPVLELRSEGIEDVSVSLGRRVTSS